jgi:hypothetical protein
MALSSKCEENCVDRELYVLWCLIIVCIILGCSLVVVNSLVLNTNKETVQNIDKLAGSVSRIMQLLKVSGNRNITENIKQDGTKFDQKRERLYDFLERR